MINHEDNRTAGLSRNQIVIFLTENSSQAVSTTVKWLNSIMQHTTDLMHTVSDPGSNYFNAMLF